MGFKLWLDLHSLLSDNELFMEGIFKKITSFFVDTIETVVVALSIFLVVYLFLMQPHQVSGLSMFPNFHDKEYILTDKVSYKLGDPKRGDVVVFHAPESAQCPTGTGCDFIKRVIAVPGDTIQIANHGYLINGRPLDENYIDDTVFTEGGRFLNLQPVTLGPDEYFVSGDNRPHSSDSREWGPIHKSNIVGRGLLRYWPLNKFGLIRKATYTL